MYLGKDSLGLELAKHIAEGNPTDLVTLSNLDKVFVTANDYKSAVSMFETAFKLSPTEDIGALWYFSVLRAQDPKVLFSIALKLHSMFKGSRYLFWAIIALHIQARTPDALQAREMDVEVDRALCLAERMIIKAFSPEKLGGRNLDELLLLITTLQGTRNPIEALRIFDVAENIKFPNEDERLILRADLMDQAGQHEMLLKVSAELLESRGIFDWNVWKLYIKAVDKSATRESLIKDLSNFISSIHDKTDLRSSMLARIDAGIIFGDEFCSQEELATHIIHYIEAFGDKGCCVPDVLHISKSLRRPLIEHLASICSSKPISSLDDLERNLIWHQLGRMFYATIGDNSRLCCADIEALEPLLKSASDLQHSAILSSASQYLALLYMDRGDSFLNVLRAAAYCREAVKLNPDNFGNKLVSILLYLKLGSVTLPLQLFRSLDIKQLQLDTLAYLISDHLIELGEFEHAELFFHESFFIYDENRTQSWSLIAEAISRSSYANVPEFFEFARRLEYSIQAVACICGTIRHELLTRDLETLSSYLEGLKPEELIFDDDFMKNLSDNRDRDIIELVDPAGTVKRALLEALPTFGRASILVYTFTPIFLRGLAYGSPATSDLHERLSANMKHLGAGQITATELAKLEFIKKIVLVCKEYEDAQRDFSVFVDGLRSIRRSFAETNVSDMIFTAEVLPTYDKLAKIHCLLEREVWVVLSMAFAIMGTPSSKSRKNCKSIASELLADIREAFVGFRERLNQSEAAIRNTQCPIPIGAEGLWSDLVASWCLSLLSYAGICANGLGMIQSIQEL